MGTKTVLNRLNNSYFQWVLSSKCAPRSSLLWVSIWSLQQLLRAETSRSKFQLRCHPGPNVQHGRRYCAQKYIHRICFLFNINRFGGHVRLYFRFLTPKTPYNQIERIETRLLVKSGVCSCPGELQQAV